MAEQPTEESFSKHIDTKFRVQLEAPQPVELKLVEVRRYTSGSNEQGGMERFSAFFYGPPDIFLQQGMYPLRHEEMGDIEIFLVPVGQDERGFRYEAVYNYFKK